LKQSKEKRREEKREEQQRPHNGLRKALNKKGLFLVQP